MSYSSIQKPEVNISLTALKEELSSNPKQISQKPSNVSVTTYSERLLEIEEYLKRLKKQPVVFSPPLITRSSLPVIFRHTINVIQGQTGVHKSRFGSHLASLLLRNEGDNLNLLDFECMAIGQNMVTYIDTERNLSEQFPRFIQEIQENAGHEVKEDPVLFRYTSLLEVPRAERFTALNEYLYSLRKSTIEHMVIFLDVLTDCVEDFNRADKSLELIDFLNRMINEHKCTFICIIHENPGQGKARGHLGTELGNKASTIIQIAFEKGPDAEDSEILKVKFLKCRSSAKLPSFYAYYSKEENRLMIADERNIKSLQNSRQTMALESDVIEALEELFQTETALTAAGLTSDLKAEFGASEKTIQRRLSEIMANQTAIYIRNKPWVLDKRKDGRVTIYFITPQKTVHEPSFIYLGSEEADA